ncbi:MULTISPECIES: GntG family PLP-dependent aldolase [unclassified Candidatus Frackibacter]|uniref:GntG family PLP-dependent aldolase n=1 Tax=unclassified Candidatus Frackibacter TaxID=2648818 RepID=UPI000799B310|nr:MULTISPECIES: GntG family PLP-dependent aldolase [unclassified Candidatus Frackibacter]KXS45974.1 MAG: threonine aldolase [Candidatus Frackibacter sp. T328-2]SDC03706.1 L-threonine aldolase [Candidatus Frackibacter sp. WG11]SFL80018.1 L-threonine aldolase [Candidatus Frackibacter sp. WG13]
MQVVDLRSDTITKPTPKMREVMAKAEVGDDVYGEDPTVNRLEELAAEIVGKEAALFVPSGTMGNQIALMTHTKPGDEIILGQESHIFYYEVGGLARISNVQARTLDDSSGIFSPEAVKATIRDENIHYPETGLICLENTHNRGGGVAIVKERIDQVCSVAQEYSVPVHLDGARIFNAALELEIDVKKLVEEVDSVMFCLSKALAAPVGSILAGSKDFIDQARKNRKMLGGGMRQAGVIAAAGIVALEEMVHRLEEDHKLAEQLAQGIAESKLDGIGVEAVNTNFVILKVDNEVYETEELLAKFNDHGVKMTYFGPGLIRAVTNKDVTSNEVDYVVDVLKKL